MTIDAFSVYQTINFCILMGILFSPLIALILLRRRKLTGAAPAIWAFIIILIPLLGAIAFFIVSPKNKPRSL